ncbi:MAG: DUF3015 family protein [Thiotrichales bacterium]
MKKIVLAFALLGAASVTHAGSGPGCGLGQQAFEGQTGLFAHVLAATTNGTSFNQWFGLSFDSLGCQGESTVTAQYQQNLYVATHYDNIARDAANGGGDHLQSLAELKRIDEADRATFYRVTQRNFDSLFGASAGGADMLLSRIDSAMSVEPQLSRYVTQ